MNEPHDRKRDEDEPLEASEAGRQWEEQMLCGSCGAHVPGQQQVCPECGGRIDPVEDTTVVWGKRPGRGRRIFALIVLAVLVLLGIGALVALILMP